MKNKDDFSPRAWVLVLKTLRVQENRRFALALMQAVQQPARDLEGKGPHRHLLRAWTCLGVT